MASLLFKVIFYKHPNQAGLLFRGRLNPFFHGGYIFVLCHYVVSPFRLFYYKQLTVVCKFTF
nr:MAG TPA: hypothetical protein [Caudoviricetes sp.]